MAVVEEERPVLLADPIPAAVRVRPPRREGLEERFGPSDPPRTWDVTARSARLARLVRSRRFQFALILPNQIIFWAVILIGLAGTVVPGLNFGTAITWYVWFCLVFVMMVVIGRAWCAMCPFGGFAEWIQRRSLWRRTQKALGLGRPMPAAVATYGFLVSAATFLVLTYIEEFFNIAGPGTPSDTSWMVVGIVASALVFFLVFERRSFCRYVCPLSGLIGTVGSMGAVAGFRTRDREVCLTCPTKDCMRGGEDGYGCPWYTWPGSADSNLYCGLCSECYKACPSGNVGLFVQRPLTSVVAPRRRRVDVAWVVAVLWGLVLFQQINATNGYTIVDDFLNRVLHFPHYPNPIAYFGVIGVLAAAMAGVAAATARILGRRELPLVQAGRDFLSRASRFRAFFVPMMYGLIPVVGADYFARQLPKFFKHSARLVPSVLDVFGGASTRSGLYHTRILGDPGIVVAQLVVIGLGALAAAWTSWRIAGAELAPHARSAVGVRVVSVGLALACGAAAAVLYVLMHAAS
jgi:NosR/NirI family nitrous oxide reductase transcriptional regulator